MTLTHTYPPPHTPTSISPQLSVTPNTSHCKYHTSGSHYIPNITNHTEPITLQISHIKLNLSHSKYHTSHWAYHTTNITPYSNTSRFRYHTYSRRYHIPMIEKSFACTTTWLSAQRPSWVGNCVQMPSSMHFIPVNHTQNYCDKFFPKGYTACYVILTTYKAWSLNTISSLYTSSTNLPAYCDVRDAMQAFDDITGFILSFYRCCISRKMYINNDNYFICFNIYIPRIVQKLKAQLIM